MREPPLRLVDSIGLRTRLIAGEQMRVTRPVVLSVLLGLQLTLGQWLETTIDVPERFCGSLLRPHVAIYNPANGRVYIGGDGGSDVVVLDATTGAKAAKIPTGSAVNDACCDSALNIVYFVTSSGRLIVVDGRVDTVVATVVLSGEATGVCFAPQENKVYCAGWYPNIVTVVDGLTNQVVTTVPVLTGERKGLCYYPSGRKVYCTSTISKTLVIDCQADTVIDTIPVGEWAHRIFYDSVNDKIYTVNFNDDNLTAIDPSADTVLATIAVPGGPMALCYGAQHNRLFCASGGAVSMIDPTRDSVVKVVNLPVELAGRDIYYNALSDRVYCVASVYIFPVLGSGTSGPPYSRCLTDTSDGLVLVVDGATGALIRHLVVGLSPEAVSGSPCGDRVFVTNYDGNDAAMLDATADSMLATIALNGGPRALTWAGTGNKAYCGNKYTHNVTVLDGETDSVLKSIPVGGEPYSLCYNSVNNKVYSSLENDNFVKVIDASSDSTVATVPTAGKPRALCYSSQNNRVYCAVDTAGTRGNVTVIDGASNAKVAQVTTGKGAWKTCYNPSSNKVYCANSKDNSVSVVSCSTNTVIATVSVVDAPVALCYNVKDNKVYCATPQGIAVIDGATDQIITTLTYGMGPVANIGLCYSNAEDKVYCSYYWYYHTAYYRVAIYDGFADTAITTITVPGKPSALYCNEQNNKVYCANQGSGPGVVTVIDGATNQVLSSIPVGNDPVAFGHNRRQNRVYVANYGSSTLSVLRDSGGGGCRELRAPSYKPQTVADHCPRSAGASSRQ
jgi:YVTN family beta-propeller protein